MSKAIADKCDAGMIMMPVVPGDLEMLQKVVAVNGGLKPTHVTDIYKLRRGRYKKTRVWHNFDLGTCRLVDLFVTDAQFNPVPIDIIRYDYQELIEENEEEKEESGW